MLDNSEWQIPSYTYEDLKRYIEDGTPTGDFLYAVLTNNLIEAMVRADSQNSKKLKEICNFIYHEIPNEAWGTKEKVNNWIKIRRLKKC